MTKRPSTLTNSKAENVAAQARCVTLALIVLVTLGIIGGYTYHIDTNAHDAPPESSIHPSSI